MSEDRTLLTVKAGPNRRNILRYNNAIIPAAICQQSLTLRGHLKTPGQVTLPMPPSSFETWADFAKDPKATVARMDKAHTLPSLIGVIEVSHYLRDRHTEKSAVTHAAAHLRLAYRDDHIEATPDAGEDGLTFFPHAVPAQAGPHLRSAVALLPPLSAIHASKIVQHLTFTEALLLPPPFPSAALAHFLSTTGDVLDLSPPRVPVHSPESLACIIRLISPLLAYTSPLMALHIPAPCLACPRDIGPIVPHLTRLTRLCITDGKVMYHDPGTGIVHRACRLETRMLVPLLCVLPPSSLCHLGIDAVLDAHDELVQCYLTRFTALTALRLRHLPVTLSSVPRLESLVISNMAEPANHAARCDILREVAAAPQLQNIHVSGCTQGVADVWDGFLDAPQAVQEGAGGGPRLKIPPVLICEVFTEGRGGNVVLCCGFPLVPGAASLYHEGGGYAGCASTEVQFFGFPKVWETWGPDAAPDGKGPAAGLLSLTLVVLQSCGTLVDLARRLLTGEVPHKLRAFCVFFPHQQLPPRSVYYVARPEPEDRWVTARMSGVAHPLCALEMLHYNKAPQPSAPGGPSPVPPAAPSAASVPVRPGFDTLRLTSDCFPVLKDLLCARTPGCLCAGVQDLSLHFDSCKDRRVDLSCLHRLSKIRNLALEGIDYDFMRLERRCLPPTLATLRIAGKSSEAAPLDRLVAALRSLLRLQCLDIEMFLDIPGLTPGMCGHDIAAGAAATAMRSRLWKALRPVLRELPLDLGVTVSVYTIF